MVFADSFVMFADVEIAETSHLIAVAVVAVMPVASVYSDYMDFYIVAYSRTR